MIKIDYSNREIKVYIEKISQIFEVPLRLKIISQVSGRQVWSSELNDDWWATFPNNELNDVHIFDKNDVNILIRKWNVIDDGSDLYRSLYLYCNKISSTGKKPKGMAVGTHDGEFGEWVPVIMNNISDGLLIEASEKQFKKLYENYNKYENVKLLNCLVSTDGEDVEFFEGGEGYTNSIVERVIRNWETETIGSSIRKSTSINHLMNEKYDWLHTDVEGYDAKLIMGIDIDLLPDFIMFEHENLESEEKKELDIYLRRLGYKLNYKDVSCLAIR